MEAKNATFGVEIECFIPREYIEEFRAESYRRGIQIIGAPEGWAAKTDSSLTNIPSGFVPVEVVSPVLKGEDGLTQTW